VDTLKLRTSEDEVPRVLAMLEKDTEKLGLCVDALERDVVNAPEGYIDYLSAIFATGRLAREESLVLAQMKLPAALALDAAKTANHEDLLSLCKEIVKLGETARKNVGFVKEAFRKEFELPDKLEPKIVIDKVVALIQKAKTGPHCDEWGCTTCGGPLGALIDIVDMKTVVECTMLVEQLSIDELAEYIPNHEVYCALGYIVPVKLKRSVQS